MQATAKRRRQLAGNIKMGMTCSAWEAVNFSTTNASMVLS